MSKSRPSGVAAAFGAAAARGRSAFIPFIMACDPDRDATPALAGALAGAGADLIEIGVPFSDPLADGPTIQRAGERALAAGATLARIVEDLPRIREQARVPIILMSYLNPVLRYGLRAFARDARRGGADGAILTDLPVEEAGDALAAFDREGLDLIALAAPTSGPERLRRIARNARGFVYCIARTGVTGARSELPAGVPELVSRVRAACGKPVALGFGITTPQHARAAARVADGVVVGSAIVERVARGTADRAAMLADVAGFAAALAETLDRGPGAAPRAAARGGSA